MSTKAFVVGGACALVLGLNTPAQAAAPTGVFHFAWVVQGPATAGGASFSTSNDCAGGQYPGTLATVGHNYPSLGASLCATTPDWISGVKNIGSFSPGAPITPIVTSTPTVLNTINGGAVGGDFGEGQLTMYAFARGASLGIFTPKFHVYDLPPANRVVGVPGYLVGVAVGTMEATNYSNATLTFPIGVSLAANANPAFTDPTAPAYAVFASELSVSLRSPAGVLGPILGAPYVTLGFVNGAAAATGAAAFVEAGSVPPVPPTGTGKGVNNGAFGWGLSSFTLTVPPAWTVVLTETLTLASDPGMQVIEAAVPTDQVIPSGGGGETNAPVDVPPPAPALPPIGAAALFVMLLTAGLWRAWPARRSPESAP